MNIELSRKAFLYFNENQYKASYIELFNYLQLENEFDPVIIQNFSRLEYLSDEQKSKFIFNYDLTLVYEKLTGHNWKEQYNRIVYYKQTFISERQQVAKFVNEFCNQISQPYELNTVVHLQDQDDQQIDENDIYIYSLEYFKKHWKVGVSFYSYLNYIYNELNIYIDREVLVMLYQQITTINPFGISIYKPQIASLESMLGLLEYQELKESLAQSLEAKKQAKISLWVAIGLGLISLVTSIIFGINQWKSGDEKTNNKPIKTNIQIEYPIIKPTK